MYNESFVVYLPVVHFPQVIGHFDDNTGSPQTAELQLNSVVSEHDAI